MFINGLDRQKYDCVPKGAKSVILIQSNLYHDAFPWVLDAVYSDKPSMSFAKFVFKKDAELVQSAYQEMLCQK